MFLQPVRDGGRLAVAEQVNGPGPAPSPIVTVTKFAQEPNYKIADTLDHLVAGGVPLFGGDGHYNPRGNHFFAYALKDSLLELLDPKPLPYQGRGPETVDFSAYLPGS